VMLPVIAETPALLYTSAILFGLGVGNLVTLPSLILQREWPREQFATLISLSLAINQVTFAFGPAVIGFARDWSGGYTAALLLCAALQAVAAMWVLYRPRPATVGDVQL
jgi:cyanate permease